jgi:hypothetical protein
MFCCRTIRRGDSARLTAALLRRGEKTGGKKGDIHVDVTFSALITRKPANSLDQCHCNKDSISKLKRPELEALAAEVEANIMDAYGLSLGAEHASDTAVAMGIAAIGSMVGGILDAADEGGNAAAGGGATRGMGGRTLSQAEQAEFETFAARARSAGLVESPYRTGSWGTIDSNGKFQEVTRVDVGEAGQAGWRGPLRLRNWNGYTTAIC